MNPIDRLRKPASALASSENGSTSPTRTQPPLGVSSVPRMFKSVDFPDPLGPTIANRSPGDSFRLTPVSTTSGVVGVGYSLRRSVTIRSAAVGMMRNDTGARRAPQTRSPDAEPHQKKTPARPCGRAGVELLY